MKPLIFLAALLLSTNAFAVSFDTEGFGQSLNGWSKKRTATYDFTDAKYRTHIPTLTGTPSGGLFLSTQVDLLAAGDQRSTCHINLTFSSTGTLESAQIRGTVGNKAVDTGLIRRPEAPEAPIAAEGAPAPVRRPFHATDELIAELFSVFDAEVKKVVDAKDKDRTDLFSRLSSGGSKRADLSAGLRHNINMLLQHTRR